MKAYNPHEIEPRLQLAWEEAGLYTVPENSDAPKKYVLEMFPYPSGDMHMGHASNYTYGDVVARYSKMQGFDVLHPMGWDAFGLPAENAAIKHHSHPAIWTYENIETQKKSFSRMGFSYDWDRKVVACDPEYYRWGPVDLPEVLGARSRGASQLAGELVSELRHRARPKRRSSRVAAGDATPRWRSATSPSGTTRSPTTPRSCWTTWISWKAGPSA